MISRAYHCYPWDLHSGQYTCEASNTLGSSRDSIIVVGKCRSFKRPFASSLHSFLLATIAFWFSGTPEAPVLGPATVHRGSLGSGQLTLGWKTISYSPVLQHEVLIQQVFTVFLDAHRDKRNDQKDDYLENWEELKVKPKEQPRNHRFQVFSASFLSNLT